MTSFQIDVYYELAKSSKRSGTFVLFMRDRKRSRRDMVAEFPMTDTGAFALSKLLEGMQYDVHGRVIAVTGLISGIADPLDADAKGEQLTRDFNLLQTADRLVTCPRAIMKEELV